MEAVCMAREKDSPEMDFPFPALFIYQKNSLLDVKQGGKIMDTQMEEQGDKAKTFTQEEVNAIIQERLAKEKAKYEKQIADMQADIKYREKRLEAVGKLKEKGIPEELVDLVKLDDDKAFNVSMELLERTYKQTQSGTKKEDTEGTSHKGYKPKGGITVCDDPIREAMGLD